MNRTRARKDKISGEVVAYSELAMRQNYMILEYCRTSMAALSGAGAGILGLTNLIGFAFYFIMALTLWGLFLMKAGPQWTKYFTGRLPLLTNGLFNGLFTYILFWTFLYGMVHVY